MTTLNRPLLLQVLGQITAFPELWNQGTWFGKPREEYEAANSCGTAGCMAGWVAVFDERIQIQGIVPGQPRVAGDYMIEDVLFNGTSMHVSQAAREALGLTINQSTELFAGGNTYEEVIRIIKRILTEPERTEVTVTLSGQGQLAIEASKVGDFETALDALLAKYRVGTWEDPAQQAVCVVALRGEPEPF